MKKLTKVTAGLYRTDSGAAVMRSYSGRKEDRWLVVWTNWLSEKKRAAFETFRGAREFALKE